MSGYKRFTVDELAQKLEIDKNQSNLNDNIKKSLSELREKGSIHYLTCGKKIGIRVRKFKK